MTQNTQPDTNSLGAVAKKRAVSGCLVQLYKNAAIILVVLIVGLVLFQLARAAVYKIRPYERGLHMRGGSFVAIDEPGWHIQIPFVDTVFILNVIERANTIDNLAAMTADDVTMDISLLYTFRVKDPVRYQLEVLDPDKIVSGFVQGTLRDIMNARKMNDVLHGRTEINQELFTALQKKESDYGVEFVLVQIQNASPPAEVVTAIKEKMVATQLQEKASAEAEQQVTVADSQFYTAQKQAEGDAYQITKLAEAEAQRTNLNSAAQVEALRNILKELEGKGTLAEQYIQVLIAQELRNNSKVIITNNGTLPIIDLSGQPNETQPTATPAP